MSDSMSETLVRLTESVEKIFNSNNISIKAGANGGVKLTIDLKTERAIQQTVERLSRLAE
jgi:hypothetical protein